MGTKRTEKARRKLRAKVFKLATDGKLGGRADSLTRSQALDLLAYIDDLLKAPTLPTAGSVSLLRRQAD